MNRGNKPNNQFPSEYDLSVRKEHRIICRSFAGLLFVIVLALISNPPQSDFLCVILILFSVSIPSSIASSNIERNTEYGKKHNSERLHLVSMIFTYIPAIAAISLLISSVSVAAGATFSLACITWVWVIAKQGDNT
jgi:hypothetical protein